ncbi:MAG: hypothetical protein M3088_05610 [Actinomycetota bacterium]|nr:hypothetical protein [Actinomycetota bacterium]
MVGARRVGYYAALLTAAVTDVRQIVFHDLNRERARRLPSSFNVRSAGELPASPPPWPTPRTPMC